MEIVDILWIVDYPWILHRLSWNSKGDHGHKMEFHMDVHHGFSWIRKDSQRFYTLLEDSTGFQGLIHVRH